MQRRYIIHPGFVTSKSDGDVHWISGPRLAELYGVPYSQCIRDDDKSGMTGVREDDRVHLWPRADGDYRLPSEVLE